MSQTERDSTAAQLRRRRAAADRLPVLEDGSGRRDPLHPVSRRDYKPASVTLDEARGVVLVRGYQAGDVLRSYELRCLWSAAGRGWCLDAHHTSDVLAMLEAHGYRVTYRERAA